MGSCGHACCLSTGASWLATGVAHPGYAHQRTPTRRTLPALPRAAPVVEAKGKGVADHWLGLLLLGRLRLRLRRRTGWLHLRLGFRNRRRWSGRLWLRLVALRLLGLHVRLGHRGQRRLRVA